MGSSRRSNRAGANWAAAGVFGFAGVGVASLYLRFGPEGSIGGFWGAGAVAGSLILICAGGVVLFRPRLGYALGGIGGVFALPWFVLSEAWGAAPSIWMDLNGPDEFAQAARPFAILKILCVALLVAAVSCSVLRLPRFPWSDRT